MTLQYRGGRVDAVHGRPGTAVEARTDVGDVEDVEENGIAGPVIYAPCLVRLCRRRVGGLAAAAVGKGPCLR